MKKSILLFFFLSFILSQRIYCQEWKILFKKGQETYETGEVEKSLPFFEKAKTQAEKEFGKQHINYIQSLDRLATLYQELAIQPEGYVMERQVKYDNKSVDMIREALIIRKKILSVQHESYLIWLNNLCIILERLEKYEEIQPLKIEIVGIIQKNKGENNLEYIDALYELANLSYITKKYTEAEKYYEQTISLYTKLTDNTPTKYAIYANGLANNCIKMEKYAQAELLYFEVLKIRRITFANEKKYLITDINNLASVYYQQEKYAKAETLLLEIIELSKNIFGEQTSEYAKSIFNLAVVYFAEDNYTKAELFYTKAFDIYKKIGDKNDDYALCLNGLATLYYQQGNYEKALSLFLESKNILKKENPKYIMVIRNLGSLYNRKGLYQEAEILIIESKNLAEKYFGKQHSEYAIGCNNLAFFYEKQQLYTKAELLYKEAKDIQEKILGKMNLDYATSCNNLANLSKKKTQYNQAENLYLESKKIIENRVGKENIIYANACINLGLLYEIQDLNTKASPLLAEANQVYFAQIDKNFTSLSEKEKALFYQTFSFNFELFNSFVTKRYKENPSITIEAYNNILATKALLFNANNKIRERILNGNDENLKKIFQHWKDKKEYLAKIYTLSLEEKTKKGINVPQLETETNDLEKQLSQKSELFATANDKKRYTWLDVQKKLKKEEVAIEIIRFQKYNKKWTDTIQYMALVIKPESKYPEMLLLENGNDLEGKYAKYYQNVIKNKVKDKNSYLQYWQKINDHIKGAKKVYLSVDGIYNSLNINTFINPATEKYMADEIEIELVTNTKDLLIQRKTTDKNIKNSTLMGFPDYNNEGEKNNKKTEERNFDVELSKNFQQLKKDTLKRFFDSNENIAELTGTKTEVENLEKILQNQKVIVQKFLGKTSTENNLKTLQSPQVLHIATHGFFLNDIESNKDDTKTLGIDNQKLAENPLLRSGLLFANAKNALKDGSEGILTAYEAMNLNLDNTDLVVMSACETGLGEVRNGEGVYGLQRAFQTAGARTILMSLWTVSDDATQELMTLFYENWVGKKLSKRQAFKNAQNQLRKKYPEPYFWGAFVMIGE